MSAPICAKPSCNNLGVYYREIIDGERAQTVYMCPDHKAIPNKQVDIFAGEAYWYDNIDDQMSAGQVVDTKTLDNSRHRPVRTGSRRP